MNLRNDAYLCAKHPRLYAARGDSMTVTCMCWGFECGDGWYKLIKKLSARLESMIAQWIKDNPGNPDFPRASQVKEKYGTLRFYMTHSTDEMEAAIREAEQESGVTCMTCGKPGKMRGKGWLYVACDKHTKEGD